MKAETKESLRVTGFVALSALTLLTGAALADLFYDDCSNSPCAPAPGVRDVLGNFTILYILALGISLVVAALTRGSREAAIIHETLAAIGAALVAVTVAIALTADEATIALREAQADVAHGHHAFMCATGIATALVLTVPLILRVVSRPADRALPDNQPPSE